MKLYFRGFIFLIGLIWHCKAQCPTPTATAGITVEEIVQGELAVHTCPDGEEFTTGDKALVTQCEGTTWETFSATCQAMSDPNLVCDVDLTIPDTTLDDVYSNSKYKVFECIDDLVWLSGQKKQVSQCKYGEWTPVLDVCDSVCDIPRECSGVASLGFNESGWFNVIPSGNLNDPAKLVFCEIDASADPMRQNWTLVLVSKDTDTMTKPSEQYINGFGDDTVATSETLIEYFIGLESLAGWGNSENPLPMVLEIEFQKEISGETHSMYATYSNFQVGEGPNYRLNSIGDYHGDAGDGLCCHVEMDFMVGAIDANTQGNFWWGNPGGVTTAGQADYDTFMERIKDQKGSYLTATGTPNWYPLVKPNVDPNVEDYFFAYTSVTMRVRPVHIENTTFCPPRHGSEPYWERTIVNFKNHSQYYRSPGHVIHYWCKGDLQREGLEGGPRSVEGTITCEGDPPRWSPDVYLPCTLDCPDGYNISSDGETCYRFSKDDAKDLVDAAQKCLKEKASMAYFHNEDDFQIAETGVKYMTGYTGRTTPAAFQGPEVQSDPDEIILPPNLDPIADPSPITDCLILDGAGGYEYTDCEAPITAKYVCQRPGLCPTGFHYVMGGCYKESSAEFPTFLEAYKDCLNDGAGLAYPTTDDQVADIFGAANFTLAYGTPFYLGLNDAKGTGDWSLNNVYNITFDISEINKTIPGRWLMSQHIDPTFTNDTEVITWLEPSAIDPIDPSAKGLCQLHAPAHCAPYNTTNGPPLPLSNMYAHGDSISSPDTHIHVNDATDITYTCYSGYFVNANTSLTIQTAKCLGQLGGWITVEHTTLQPCELFPVCENMTSSAPLYTHLMDIITYDNSSYLNGSVYYECPINMTTESGDTLQPTTCVIDTAAPLGYKYDPDILQECKVCVEEPIFINATTTFATNGKVLIDSSVTATCITDYEFGFLEDGISVVTQDVLCTAYSWNWTDVNTICQPACTIHPPLAGDNMIRDNITSRVVGTQVNYTCAESYNIRPTQNFSRRDANETFVTCTEPRTWDLERVNEALQCVKVCQADPPEAPLNSTRTWDGFSRAENDSITYTCDNTFLFPNYSQVVVIHCNGTHWEEIPPEEFVCNQACTLSIEREHGGGLVDWYDSEDALYIPAWPGEAANYSCPERQATKNGTYNTTIHCQKDGNWSVADSTFQCFNACDGAPPLPPLFSSYNFSEAYPDFTDGVVITYVCPGYFATGNLTLDNICQDFNWTLLEIPDCRKKLKYPPIVLEGRDLDVDLDYAATTDMHFGTLQNSMTDINGVDGNYGTIEGPFGFGYAVALKEEEEQCLRNQEIPEHACLHNPFLCKEGISISLWERYSFRGDIYNDYMNYTDEDKDYLISTGGDENGHPGIAMYHTGMMLTVLVSVGGQYWKVTSFNQMQNYTWTNIGFTWNYTYEVTTPDLRLEYYGGLKVYVDGKLIASVLHPSEIAPKPGLDPPEMMLGCHKTTTDPEYRGFNDNEYDEFALWKRALPDNETDFLLGGFETTLTSIDPAEFNTMLNRVQIEDPAQFGAVLDHLLRSTGDVELPANPGKMPQLTEEQKAEQKKKKEAALKSSASSVILMTNINKLPPSMEFKETCGRMKMGKLVSNMLAPSSKSNWHQIQSDRDKAGINGIVTNFQLWTLECLKRTEFNYSRPLYCNRITDNALYETSKMKISDWLEKGDYFITPNFRRIKFTDDLKQKWNLPQDRVEVPVDVFGLVPEACEGQAVNFVSQKMDTYGPLAAVRINQAYLDEGAFFEVDSSVMNVVVHVDPILDEEGDINPRAPNCQPKKEELLKNPVRVRLAHLRKEMARNRKLHFHEDEITSQTLTRHCVWWNRHLGDFGTWDSSGCTIVETTDEYTKCNCEHFGTFAILAEKVPKKEIPEEYIWLTIVRYTGYLLSGALLIFYIYFVLRTEILKEQFHLIGVNISIAVLCGSVAMVVSDLEAVRNDRHTCTAIGTVIHYFYGTVGLWIGVLGQAAMRAVNYGVVGGQLRAYILLTWGTSIALIGIPFVYDLHSVGTDLRCMISWDYITKSIFFIPQCIMGVFATLCSFGVLCNLATPALRKDNLISDYGTFCRGGAIVMIYISITWFTGAAANIKLLGNTLDFYPVFQVLNSFTGIIIFVFIGIFSKRFFVALTGKIEKHHKHLEQHPFGMREDDEVDNEKLKYLENEDEQMLTGPSSAPTKRRPLSSRIAGSSKPRPVSS